jgi:hypothetical protein
MRALFRITCNLKRSDNKLKTLYKAFGLKILSEINLPELLINDDKNINEDVNITYGNQKSTWNEIGIEGKFAIHKEKVLFVVKKSAILCIQDGNSIIVTPLDGYDESKIRLYLLGTCMGIILLQRGILPLHGSAVAIEGKAYAFVGNSGAGKSTLASTLLKNGYSLMSDDVLAISYSKEGIPLVFPSYPQQKLWDESLKMLGMENNNYLPLYERETKYSVPVRKKFNDQVLPLSGVFVINKTEDDKINIDEIIGLEKFNTVFQQTFRNVLLGRLGLLEWHFQNSGKFINKVKFYRVERPIKGDSSSEIATLILKKIKEGVI